MSLEYLEKIAFNLPASTEKIHFLPFGFSTSQYFDFVSVIRFRKSEGNLLRDIILMIPVGRLTLTKFEDGYSEVYFRSRS